MIRDLEQERKEKKVEKETVMRLCEALNEKKAKDIIALHVAEKTIVAEWFIIASGTVPAQTKTLSDELEEKAREMGLLLRRIEGYSEGRWIVQDYGDLLVHLFIPEERRYYNMERLWDEENNAIRFDGPGRE